MNIADYHFLVVDDDDLDRETIVRAFKKLGITKNLHTASDGIEALQVLRGETDIKMEAPIVILLDLNMPRMGGIEFLKELRADPKLKSISTFAITTSSDQIDVRAAHEQNVSGYLVKPVNRDELAKMFEVLKMFLETCHLPTPE